MHLILRAALTAFGLTLASCAPAQEAGPVPDYVIAAFGAPPEVIPSGPLPAELSAAIETVFVDSLRESVWGEAQQIALARIRASGDPRLAWTITDMMRFTWRASFDDALADAAAHLLEVKLKTPQRWGELTDYLIAWDIPAYPGYLGTKRAIFTQFQPNWAPLFVPGEIDWRMVSWGGVPMDARAFGTTDEPCNCIPAADDPEVSAAEDATWLRDDDVVFGIEINGEARAYPRRIMEVREMVNDTLGGRDLGIPYCTLCGAAQAYFTDDLPAGVQRPVLRTSGLLIRSNKVMFDLETYSVFDTFLGKAVTGPLARRGITLDQATVITTDWGTWKAEYPHTTVLLERYALGRDFNFREGRDARGPIFPVGDVDPRLPVHEDVIGVIAPSGTPIAFPRGAALVALRAGAEVSQGGVQLVQAAGGLRAADGSGQPIPSHEAFWFAWSQFHEGTALWRP
ncbi:MAG: DUF3179 domain-containing (seleno)protein [Pseudomonadota bacterium]